MLCAVQKAEEMQIHWISLVGCLAHVVIWEQRIAIFKRSIMSAEESLFPSGVQYASYGNLTKWWSDMRLGMDCDLLLFIDL